MGKLECRLPMALGDGDALVAGRHVQMDTTIPRMETATTGNAGVTMLMRSMEQEAIVPEAATLTARVAVPVNQESQMLQLLLFCRQ